MPNKNPASRLVNIPSQFMPLVEKEMNETGCYTYCETMGRILAQYFNGKHKAPSSPKTNTNTVIKGVKPHAK